MSTRTSDNSRTPSRNSGSVARFPGARDIIRAWSEGLRPPRPLLVSEWADAHRVLAPRASAEPGRYRTDRTPYMREIMDALSPSDPVQRVVLMKAAQVGATEAGNNWIGFVIDHAPAPMLAVQPTVELAKRNSRQRIDPLIEESPTLRARVKPARSRDAGNTMLSKEFTGGILVMTGANSAVGLRSMPARNLFLDEVDAYPDSADEEGDPIALAEARSLTYAHRRKVFVVSTPTIKGASRIEREFAASDQRRYFVPCPDCGALQWLKFERLRWDEGDPDGAAYQCEHCEALIAEHHKTAMLAAGEWRPTAESKDPHTAGYHISGLYSPIGWLSWGQIARQWEAAQGSDELLKTFNNTALGEPWLQDGDAPDAVMLWKARVPGIMRGVIPPGPLVLTGAVDVQGNRLEWGVWGWSEGLTRWLVDYGIIEGDPNDVPTWSRLDREVILKRWELAGGYEAGVEGWAVDSGFATQAVYNFTRGRPRVLAVKGMPGRSLAMVGSPSRVDVNWQGRRIPGGAMIWPMGAHALKVDHYSAVRKAIAGPDDDDEWAPGAMILPFDVDQAYCEQLTAEQLVRVERRTGLSDFRWEKMKGRPNEALDIACYARGMAYFLGLDRLKAEHWAKLRTERVIADDEGGPEPVHISRPEQPEPAARPQPARRERLRRDRDDWLKGRGEDW